MLEDKNEQKNEEQSVSPQEANDFEFLKEKIKERPIDKKKLVQRLVITASMALIFGIIACLTFLLLEPVLNNWLHPEKEPDIVTFPEEEILPENMLSEENTKPQTEEQSQCEEESTDNVSFEEMIEIEQGYLEEDGTFNEEAAGLRIAQYQLLYQDLYYLSQNVKKSMVQVTGVSSQTDWFNNAYENQGVSAGLVIANNGREILVLCDYDEIRDVETITVTFGDGKVKEASLKKFDNNTGLAVIAIALKDIPPATLDIIEIATLGSSNDTTLVGQPIMAIGQVNGYNDSICYGMLTSISHSLIMADNQYKLLTTDIFSSQKPSGILVNMNGEVIGIIKNDYNSDEAKNMLSAIGITELKGMVSKLSNNISVPYLGVYVMDVPEEVHTSLKVPKGAYVTDIDMDSPAMRNGMQKGDIIVQVGDMKIETSTQYMMAVRQYLVDKTVTVTVLRPSQEAFQEMSFEMMLGTKE